MKTDVIVVSNGNNGLIYRCLCSLAEHSKPEQLGRVCISWNGDDETRAKVEKQCKSLGFDWKLECLPYHFAKNNNFMAKLYCHSDALMFLNDDVELRDNFIERALSVVEKANVGTVGCKLVRLDKKIQHAGVICGAFPNGSFAGACHFMYNKDDEEMSDMAPLANTAACMMIRRHLFEEAGGFNPEYLECFEDLELNLRCVLGGKTNICLASCTELHDESMTRDPHPRKEDFARIADFWNANIVGFMKAASPSCKFIARAGT